MHSARLDKVIPKRRMRYLCFIFLVFLFDQRDVGRRVTCLALWNFFGCIIIGWLRIHIFCVGSFGSFSILFGFVPFRSFFLLILIW